VGSQDLTWTDLIQNNVNVFSDFETQVMWGPWPYMISRSPMCIAPLPPHAIAEPYLFGF